ncbi:MAG: hydrogenase maturation protease [Candidatus Lokiarchaeota archaeon]|nr:hydrogenase maturation protease [Candidatus Lokiarchaeota archaeon]MBD3339873.1 hydrogenase maturation protease [Candidatus Lokiarchaeota archaeon]
MDEIFQKLWNRLQNADRIVFVGIGEEKMSDDGVGPYIISNFLDLDVENVRFINANIDPMARVDEIINFHPSHLVILDTCDLKADPGTVSILEREHMQDHVPISSHTIPIHIVIDLIVQKLPDVDVFMIGFVPQSLEGFETLRLYKSDEYSIDDKNENENLPFFDFQLTPVIQNVADQMIEIIKELVEKL